MSQGMLNEAKLFSQYLGANTDDEALVGKYIDAIEKLKIGLSEKEENILLKLQKRPFLLRFADGAWAIVNPKNGIRKRILIMSALIETQPQYFHHFFNQKDSSFAIVRLIYRGLLAIFRLVIGILMISVLRWK